MSQLCWHRGKSIRRQLRNADSFGAWLAEQNLTVAEITDDLVERYVGGLHRSARAGYSKGYADKRLVGYLTRPEMDAILDVPDCKTWSGQRNYTMLLTLYNSGARVSEITSLKRSHIRLGATSFLQLHGKGRKDREVPLWPKTARSLRLWMEATPASPDSPAFPSARGAVLSRDGVNYILQDAVLKAAKTCPSLATKRVSPHVLRHTTAMHLLQSGVDITVIALWLGHESPETTQVYIEADLKTKEQALQNVAPAGKGFQRFKPSDALLAFLDAL